MKSHNNFDERFEFTGKAKSWSLIAIGIGVVVVILGFLIPGYQQRTFSNLLLMGYYFACVCTAGVMFCAIQYAAQAGWSASVIRVPQAFARILPVAGIILIVIIIAGLSVKHTVTVGGKGIEEPYLYAQWATHGVNEKGSQVYDSLIASKSGYLNIPFFLGRIIVLLGSYSLFGWLLAKYSQNEDEFGGMRYYNKSFLVSCVFLVIFGFTVPVFAFDTIMSLEARWFSTMFGWYNLAALWVSGLAAMTLVMIRVRKAGYLSWITDDHLHNMGLFMFAFSVFWTYLWFAQFLLTYYANIPEESAYFYRRWEPQFIFWFWLNIVINFATPLLVLMTRDAKRYVNTLQTIAIILIVGHWLDYFQMIMPGTLGPKEHWYEYMTWVEPGVFIGFAGLFTYSVLTALSKFQSLIPKKHPLLEESLHHHI